MNRTYIVVLPGGWDEPDIIDRVFGSLKALVEYRATQEPRWHWPRNIQVWETDGERLGDFDFDKWPDQADKTARPSEVKANVRG